MKNVSQLGKSILCAGVTVAVVILASTGFAQAKAEKAKPYPLQTCIVSGEKLGGDMGQPHVFTYQGREIKLCCKSCLKDFNKEPTKYIKKLDDARENSKETKAKTPAHDHSQHKH